MEKDKHPIVALSRNQISKSVKKTRQHASLLLSLKKTDLELDLYNGLDPEKYLNYLLQNCQTRVF